jgi:hypothetical protein
MEMEIVGAYPVDAPEPCHLIECWVRGALGDFDIGKITQEVPSQPEDNWQVPWDEYVLNDNCTAGELAYYGDAFTGNVRIAFFFHYVDFGQPLLTPVGPKSLPTPTDRPDRLSFIEYEPPG